MRTLVGIGLAVAVLAGTQYTEPGNPEPGTDQGASRKPDRFALQLVGVSGECRIERGIAEAGGSHDLVLDARCADLYPALAQARTWRDRADGGISLASLSGEPVVVFAVSDGLDFESIEPASPIITLKSAE